MHSGSDSTESQKYTQWAMNPAAYQNAANDQVDWAALAQQWIIMKEAGPPPIPGEQQVDLIKDLKDNRKLDSEEGGEAEMEVENDKEDSIAWNPPPPDIAPPAPGAEAWTNWNASGQSWNWNNSWNPPSAVPPPPGIPPVKTPLLPTPNTVYSIPPDAGNDNAVPYGGYNTGPPASNNYNAPAFWTGMAVGKITQTEIKPHNKRYSKVNVPTKVTIITPAASVAPLMPAAEIPVVAPAPTPTLDANKRKQLPAWIREGLEKMERDKQKQLEKEKANQAREAFTEKIKLEEEETLEILKSTIKEKDMLRKSRFDSDNEDSENEKPIKRRVSPPPPVPLTQEELIMKVRKTMTEILLKVTTQHIEQICKEERLRYIKKKRASDQLASAPSGATISAKLGLGVYNDGSSSSDESDDEDKRNDKSDSDTELRESIRKRQAAFSKTAQDIEDRLAEADRRKDRSESKSRSRSSSVESDDNESQVDANTQESRRSYSESENSPKRKALSPDNSSNSSNYLESKVRRDSSSSRSSYSNSKNHGASREKNRLQSPTPETDRKGSNGSRYSRSPEKTQRSRSRSRSSNRNRSRESSFRRESTDSKKRSKRSRSDSPYSRRSRKSRSHSRSSYSSRMSSKRSRYSSRRSRSRSRSRDRRHSIKKSRRSPSRSRDSRRKISSKRSRSKSYRSERSKRSRSDSRSHRNSRSERSPASRRRRSSRSSSRGKRSHRR